jgi:hypothetical protein
VGEEGGGSGTLQRRQDILRGISAGDAVLLLGGDLSVTVVQAQGLSGNPRFTHPFARIYCCEPFPTSSGWLPITAVNSFRPQT